MRWFNCMMLVLVLAVAGCRELRYEQQWVQPLLWRVSQQDTQRIELKSWLKFAKIEAGSGETRLEQLLHSKIALELVVEMPQYRQKHYGMAAVPESLAVHHVSNSHDRSHPGYGLNTVQVSCQTPLAAISSQVNQSIRVLSVHSPCYVKDVQTQKNKTVFDVVLQVFVKERDMLAITRNFVQRVDFDYDLRLEQPMPSPIRSQQVWASSSRLNRAFGIHDLRIPLF